MHPRPTWIGQALVACLSATTFSSPAPAQGTELVSQPQGYGYALWCSVSGDGLRVAYQGTMPDPEEDPTIHIFVRDRASGSTFDLTPRPPPTQGGNPSQPSISRDGLWVVYTRTLKLVHGGTMYIYPQILRQAVDGGPFEVVSQSASGVPANSPCMEGSVSRDGRLVAFMSRASNLALELKANQGGDNDVFVRDMLLGTTTLVSVSAAGGTTSNDYSLHPAISQDGRHVAFESPSTDLVPGATNGRVHIYARDLQTAQTVRITPSGATHHSHEPALSADGRFVLYHSLASNLVPGDTNNSADIFVCDRDPDGNGILDEGNALTRRVSVGQGGLQANNASNQGSISGDGRLVVFRSLANNLVPGDVNAKQDVFARDLWAGSTWLASVDSLGTQGNGASGLSWLHAVDLADDGRMCVFLSDATNLVPGDDNGKTDVFLRELELRPLYIGPRKGP